MHQAGSRTLAGTDCGMRQSDSLFECTPTRPRRAEAADPSDRLRQAAAVGPRCQSSRTASTMGTPKVRAQLHNTWQTAFIAPPGDHWEFSVAPGVGEANARLTATWRGGSLSPPKHAE